MPTLKPFKGDHYLWTYVPNLPAAVVFATVFAALAIAHGWKTVKTKSWYCIAFVVGGCCEVIGYLARIGAYEATDSLVPFLLQGVFLVVAPVFFAASLYMVYARIVRAVHGEAFSPISSRMTTILFVVGDLTCLNIQSSGAGLLGNEKIAYIGNDIVVVGLFLQVALFIGFITTGIVFHKRFHAQTAKATISVGGVPWQSRLYMLYSTSALILVRNIYRVVEFLGGQHGYLLSNEWPLYAFDGALMMLVMIGFFVWFPARLQASSRDSMIELTSVGVRSATCDDG